MTGLPLRFAGTNFSGATNFFQGALGAGGFASSLIVASDGSAMMLRNDTAQPWQWLRSTNKWTNIAKKPGMNTIQSTTPLETVFAPSNPNIMYMVYSPPLPTQGAGGGTPTDRNYLWRSTDKGTTWTQTASTTAFCGGNPQTDGNPYKYSGPRMAVDPNNSDVVYIISATGTCYVTYDAGVTINVISGLLAALPSAVINGTPPLPGGNTFTVVSNPIPTATGGDGYFGFDPTWPLAMGTNSNDDHIESSSGTTLTMHRFQSRDGGTGALSIAAGDTVYFGRGGSVCIDSSADTIANPGGSGVISKYVYFSWQLGSSNVWRTTNGGVSWAALIDGASSGGPGPVTGKMKMSNDGTLAGGGFNTNILYVCDTSGPNNIWRYVENPPTGSGLTAQRWTNVTSSLSSTVVSIAPSPTTAGKLAALNVGGGQFLSTDFGTTYTQANGSTLFSFISGSPGAPPNGTDTPWMTGATDVSCADCEYDKGSGSIANKLWVATGIGVVYTQPTTFGTAAITGITNDATGAVVTLGSNDWIVGQGFIPSGVTGMIQANGLSFFITSIIGGGQVKTNVNSFGFSAYTGPSGTALFGDFLTTQSEAMDSLTTCKLVKAPSPNGRVLIICQDREVFSAASPTTYPTTYWPLGAVQNPTDVTYSKSDPTVVWACTNGALIKNTNSGIGSFTTANASGGWGMVASTTPSSCVLIPRPGTNVQYTTDGGSNWTNSTFGPPISGTADGTAVSPTGNAFFVVCDDFGNYYYWDWITGRFWKSTDGGANFALKSTTAFSSSNFFGSGATFCCPPGVNGDVWWCPGSAGSYIFKVLGFVSTDSGATWTAMNQASDPQNLYHIAFGAAKPGGVGYPAAFMTGFMTDPATTSMWRCDDPKNAARVWTEINNFLTVNPEGERYLNADVEVYGKVYRPLASTGYIFGQIG